MGAGQGATVGPAGQRDAAHQELELGLSSGSRQAQVAHGLVDREGRARDRCAGVRRQMQESAGVALGAVSRSEEHVRIQKEEHLQRFGARALPRARRTFAATSVGISSSAKNSLTRSSL